MMMMMMMVRQIYQHTVIGSFLYLRDMKNFSITLTAVCQAKFGKYKEEDKVGYT